MDPVGPWQFSYNRLAAAGVQGTGSSDLHHHFAQAAATNSSLTGHNSGSVPPSTTSQLLLQAAHSTPLGGSTAAAAAAFNHGSFLTPPAVGYDSVFSPLFHHANPKPAHFNAMNVQHRQVLAQAQAAVTKQAADAEIIRENYTQHHQSLAAAQSGSYFDHSSSQANATPASPLAWQGNNQLPSPFGILPHESVVPSSPGPPSSKSSSTPSAVYENFNAHFASQPLNHVNAILKSSARAVSPHVNTSSGANKTTTVATAPNSNAYYQSAPSFGGAATGSGTLAASGVASGNSNDSIPSSYSANAKQQDQYGNSGKNNRQTMQNNAQLHQHPGHQQQQQQQQQQPSMQQHHQSQSTVINNTLSHSSTSVMSPIKVLDKKYTPTGPGAGFMGSYLKFLQGERDTSPPPINRSTRKGTWSRTPANTNTSTATSSVTTTATATATNAQTLQQKPMNQVSNGSIDQCHLNSTLSHNQIQQPMGQQQPHQKTDIVPTDDSRYYPLQKDRKRSADDELIKNRNRATAANSPTPQNKKIVDRTTAAAPKRGRQSQQAQQQPLQQPPQQSQPQTMPQPQAQSQQPQHQQSQGNVAAQYQLPQPPIMQQAAPQMLQQQMYYQQPEEDPLSVPMRRETSHRKAKGRSIAALIDKGREVDYDQEEPPEFIDSDSDPAWTPQDDKDDDEDIPSRKKNRKNKSHLGGSRNKSNILSGAGIAEFYANDDDVQSQRQESSVASQQYQMNQESTQQRQQQLINQPITIPQPQMYQTNILAQADNVGGQQQHHQQHQQHQFQQQLQSLQQPIINNDDTDHFKAGDFVVNKSDLILDWPCIWRVDGKNLLQKYEPFSNNGKTLYRNMATYAAWTSESRRQYIKIPIRTHSVRSSSETYIEFLRNNLAVDDHEIYIEKIMQDMMGYQDNFEVYIQTLISQALDTNFLAEIMQEQDDYFLSNVKTIDDITLAKKQKLLAVSNWSKNIVESIELWPCYNIIRDNGQNNVTNLYCAACQRPGISIRLLLYGHQYNPTTVESLQINSNTGYEKDFLLCRICIPKIELYHKITHQKYLMYIECARHVAEKNTQDPTKASTIILNELLADDVWLIQLFKNIRRTWAEVDFIERQHRFHMSSQQ